MPTTLPDEEEVTTRQRTHSLAGKIALVTGASGGIGGAIASELAAAGAEVHAVGRDPMKLEALRNRTPHGISVCRVDLTDDAGIEQLVSEVVERSGDLDILVHSAGAIAYGRLDESSLPGLDELYAANVRAPFLLTQLCLPHLKRAQGQIGFVNSSTGVAASAGVGQFSMTQHALKAFADALRDELNAEGVRVISVYPGRTATGRMEKRFALEGREYRPELLLQPADVASVLVHALSLPRTAEVTNINVRPFVKSY